MKLIVFPGDGRLPTFSPFCLKTMCLLEMAGQDWAPEYIQDLSTMPLGKVPVLRVGERLIPDSHHIQAYLESLGADFHPGLSEQDRHATHALVRMVEENLRLGLVHDRWLNEDVWPVMRESFFAAVPAPAREQVAADVQAQVRAGLMGQGIARFDEADRLRSFHKDMDVLQFKLGDKPYLFGDQPSAADAAIAPVLDMILHLPAPTGLRQSAEAHERFAGYVHRVGAAIYPPQSRFETPAIAAAE